MRVPQFDMEQRRRGIRCLWTTLLRAQPLRWARVRRVSNLWCSIERGAKVVAQSAQLAAAGVSN